MISTEKTEKQSSKLKSPKQEDKVKVCFFCFSVKKSINN